MFRYLPENEGDLVAISTVGKLDSDDLNKLLPAIEEKIKRYGKVNFFWEMENFEGWSPLGFLKDGMFDIKHTNDFKRIAMVGDEKWKQKVADFMKPFTSAKVKYFDLPQKQQALQWAKEEIA